MPEFYVLIAAAGCGTRLGGDIPKQYQEILGKTVLRYTLESFLDCPGLKEIRVIINQEHEGLYQDAISGLDLPPPILGGKTRKDSVYKGIKSFYNLKNEDIILIHDAARPFIKRPHILAVTEAAHETGAATLALPIVDTLRRENGDYVDRENLWALQTPQAFHYGLIRKAHERATSNRRATDDTALVSALGHDIKMVTGACHNFKITTASDMQKSLKLFKAAAKKQQENS